VLQRRRRIALIRLNRAVGKMGVKIDETREHGEARPIDRRRSIRIAPGGDGGDLAVDDMNALVREDLRSGGIDQAAGVDVDRLRGRRCACEKRRAGCGAAKPVPHDCCLPTADIVPPAPSLAS